MCNKIKQWRSSPALSIICLMLAVLCVSCEQSVGFGKAIDFEAPTLTITSIILPDGTERIIEGDNRLLIGPGIRVGPECILTGAAWDNVLVTGIQVELTVKETGGTRVWSGAQIGPKGSDGKQAWRIALDGIPEGERNITVKAFDSPKNVGAYMMQSLTLLVDANPPIVESAKIERSLGVYVDLLPKSRLETLNLNKFEYVDYFQNESFTIRASIMHDFELSDVSLNFWDSEKQNFVFLEALGRTSGGLTTPAWEITEKMLTDANSAYSTGRHYLQAVISAKALAGHSGQNDVSNQLSSLCWYPEADKARILINIEEENGAIPAEKESVLPVMVFDDDSVKAVYAAMVSEADWDAFISGSSEDQKLQSLYDASARGSFSYSSALKDNRISSAVKNTTVPVTSAGERGVYRLIVLALDTGGRWTHRLFTIQVMEDGIPVISVTAPKEYTGPALNADGSFTLTGSALNSDEVAFLRIAWIPNGSGWNANDQMEKGQKALIDNAPAGGIKIWNNIALTRIEDHIIGNKTFKQWAFEQSFNFDDFKYNGSLENEPKLFILYTRSKAGIDVFLPFRLMPYTSPPGITVESPANGEEHGKNEDIQFRIRINPKPGISINPDSVKLISVTDTNKYIPLTRGTGADVNVWTSTNPYSFFNEGTYYYRVSVEDMLGNENQLEQYVIITTLPEFAGIASPHADDTTFSGRDTITIQTVFDGAVNTVSGEPRLVLGGFTDGKERYAKYAGGAGSSTLDFAYNIQPNDETEPSGLTVTAIDLNGGYISSENDLTAIPAPQMNLSKTFHVDGIAPVVTKIEFTDNGAAPLWLRAGQDLEIKVTAGKEIRVLGNPKLRLSFNSRFANFQGLENNDKTMVFTYKVQNGDNAASVSCAASLFSDTDLKIITDKAGAQGNILSLAGVPLATGNAAIDTTPPAALTVTSLTSVPPRKFQITGGIEPGAKVEYTIDNGITWKDDFGSSYTIPDINSPGNYNVIARQTDLAGNSTESVKTAVIVSEKYNLAGLICDNPDGTYIEGEKLSFRLLFDGKVTAPAGTAGPSITIGRNGPNAENITLRLASAVNTADFFLSFEWTVPAGLRWEPLVIKSISLNGVKREDSTAPGGVIANVISNYSRPGVKVNSIAPVITGLNTGDTGNVIVTQYNNATAALAALNTDTELDNNNLILTFNHAVSPENGTITIKPSGDWLIPPVLTNEEYYAVTKGNTAALDAYYTKTTHGLKLSGGKYVPDTATKYVLKFDYGLNDATIRTIFNDAGYLWQEIDVQSSQVTKMGTNQIAIQLDELPDGRIWDISISNGAFRDDTGNQSQAFSTVVWSGKTASPVIRVNRVSNNYPTANPTLNGITNGGIHRVQAQYRIDSVTPGAAIIYGTWNKGTAGIAPGTTGTPSSKDDTSTNSNIADAGAGELSSISTSMNYNYTGTNYPLMPAAAEANSLYTARKDYIAAKAQRNNLAESETGYEGVFKTLLVYRDTSGGDGNYVKIEGANVYGGQPTISGFPLSNNDMTGKSSKYAFKNKRSQSNTGGNSAGNYTDWIWISWEIISEYYQVNLRTTQAQPDGALTGTTWTGRATEFYSKRTYGNYGLHSGNTASF